MVIAMGWTYDPKWFAIKGSHSEFLSHNFYPFFCSAFTATVPRVRNNYSTFDHWSRYWLKLQGPDIKVHEEYIVYDFNGIVGTVGGSLGLFVGFSFLDFVLYLFNRAKKILHQDTESKSNKGQKTTTIEPPTTITERTLFTYAGDLDSIQNRAQNQNPEFTLPSKSKLKTRLSLSRMHSVL